MASGTSDYLKPISFLVVDDRSYMRRVIKGILETLGCKRIDEAHHGAEAVQIMRSWAPDIVLSEWLLTPMSGLEMLKTVRADKGNLKFTPIIMITSRVGDKHRARAMALGVNDYLGKPYQEGQLLDAMQPLLDARYNAG